MSAAMMPLGWYPLPIPELVCHSLLLGPPFRGLRMVNGASFSLRLLVLLFVGPLSYALLTANERGFELISVGQVISDAHPHHPSCLVQQVALHTLPCLWLVSHHGQSLGVVLHPVCDGQTPFLVLKEDLLTRHLVLALAHPQLDDH